MSKPTTITIHPRYSDFDPDAQLHPANYIRYMLQAALEAGAVTDTEQPDIEPGDWLQRIGDIGVQITKPIKFGEVIEVHTQVAKVLPAVWRREFKLKRPAYGSLAAVGFVDLFEDEDAEDDETDYGARQSRFDQVAPEIGTTWDGLVAAPPRPPAHAFRAIWQVAWANLDLSGLLDPAWLAQVVTDIDTRAAELKGWGAERNMMKGIAWSVIEQRLELFAPMRHGDTLNILSYIGDSQDDYIDRHSSIECDRGSHIEEVARARTRWVCQDTTTSQRAIVPEDWLFDLRDQLADLR